MPLNASGTLSIGGSTSGQSINLELGRAATATSGLGESALRTLAGIASGQISLSNFYGKSSGPAIGSAMGGGYYAGKISTSANGVATHYIIVSPKSSGEGSARQYKTTATADAGAQNDINGPTISASLNNAAHPAALFCEGLTIGGFSDWYLPAKNELEVLYWYLKPTTDVNSNSGTTGQNAHAVSPEPINQSYATSGTPSRTSVAAFQAGGSEAFDTTYGIYWSCTESTASVTRAWVQRLGMDGFQTTSGKTSTALVRAIRRVAI